MKKRQQEMRRGQFSYLNLLCICMYRYLGQSSVPIQFSELKCTCPHTYPYGTRPYLKVVQFTQGALSVSEVGRGQLVQGLQCPIGLPVGPFPVG